MKIRAGKTEIKIELGLPWYVTLVLHQNFNFLYLLTCTCYVMVCYTCTASIVSCDSMCHVDVKRM